MAALAALAAPSPSSYRLGGHQSDGPGGVGCGGARGIAPTPPRAPEVETPPRPGDSECSQTARTTDSAVRAATGSTLIMTGLGRRRHRRRPTARQAVGGLSLMRGWRARRGPVMLSHRPDPTDLPFALRSPPRVGSPATRDASPDSVPPGQRAALQLHCPIRALRLQRAAGTGTDWTDGRRRDASAALIACSRAGWAGWARAGLGAGHPAAIACLPSPATPATPTPTPSRRDTNGRLQIRVGRGGADAARPH